MSSQLSYNYVDNKGNPQIEIIENSDIIDEITKSKSDINDSRKFYEETFYPIWREWYKMYHLSTADRASRIKSWQQNAAFWMVRSFTDVFAATLTEKPITFNVTGVNKKGRENAENIKTALAYTADVTWFQEEVKEALKEALKTWTFAADINYRNKVKGKEYPVHYPEAKEPEDRIKMVSFDDDEISEVPDATHMSVFSFYADPYNGNKPLHVTRRKIMSAKVFTQTYWGMIESDSNLSPFKDKPTIYWMKENKNWASFLDHETIVDMIHREKAISALARDSYNSARQGSVSGVVGNILWINDERSDDGIIEVLFYERADKVVLFANNYPAYVWENTMGFITKEIQSASSAKRWTDCEWISYLVGDISRLYEAFGNSHVDNIRQVADPVFIGIKWAFLDEESIQDMEPGSVQWAENAAGAAALRRLEKGSVSDFNVMWFLFEVWSRLIGASEYDFGSSARERTAAGALAVSQSSSRRLSPFMQNFVSFISRIAAKWLLIQKQEWTDAQYINITDSEVKLSNIDLQGAVIVTLQMDSMISAINEFMYKKLIEIQKEAKGTWLVNEDELFREIFRSQGLDPTRFVPTTAPQVTVPADTPPGPEGELPPDFIPTEAQLVGQDIQTVTNPQVSW